MPDLASLTDEQRGALRELDSALDMFKQAVEQRRAAEELERKARRRLEALGYEIAGVS